MYYQNPNAQYMGAFTQGQQVDNIPWTNPLDDKGRELLKQKEPEFVLKATEEELLRSSCTHRDPQKRCATLVQDPNTGTWKCTQCGAVFNIVDLPIEKIEEYVYGMIDILQTSKLMYVNMPPQTVTSFYQMIPFLEKVPKLYQTAQNIFKKVNGGNTLQGFNYTNDPFATINNAIANPGYGMPGYGYGYGQPVPQAPVYPQYQAPPQYNNTNGFYGDPNFNPIQQQAPMAAPNYNTGMMNQPQIQQPQTQMPVNTGAPVADNTVQTAAPKEGDTVTTNKQFQI